MEGNQTFKGSWPWPWPWIRQYGIPSCITHRPLPIYQISLKSKKLFVDGRTDVRTDGHLSPSNIIRSTFGSRPKNRATMPPNFGTPTYAQIQRGNTHGEGCVRGSNTPLNIARAQIARFVSDSWACCTSSRDPSAVDL